MMQMHPFITLVQHKKQVGVHQGCFFFLCNLHIHPIWISWWGWKCKPLLCFCREIWVFNLTFWVRFKMFNTNIQQTSESRIYLRFGQNGGEGYFDVDLCFCCCEAYGVFFFFFVLAQESMTLWRSDTSVKCINRSFLLSLMLATLALGLLFHS